MKLTPRGLICCLVGLVVDTALGQIHSSDVHYTAGVLINPLSTIWHLRNIIQILHMHQSGHTRAGPAPQGQPGCELTVWSDHTPRWLAVWSCLLYWLHWCWGYRHNVGQPRVRVKSLTPGGCQAIMYQWKIETAGTIGVSGTSGLPPIGVKQLLCGGTLLASSHAFT